MFITNITRLDNNRFTGTVTKDNFRPFEEFFFAKNIRRKGDTITYDRVPDQELSAIEYMMVTARNNPNSLENRLRQLTKIVRFR